MSARGLLQNPALYAGYDKTPVECIQEWVNLSLASGLHFICFHHHLVFMVEKVMDKASRRVFNCLNTVASVVQFLVDYYGIEVAEFVPPSIKTEEATVGGKSIGVKVAKKESENSTEDYMDSCNLYV